MLNKDKLTCLLTIEFVMASMTLLSINICLMNE